MASSETGLPNSWASGSLWDVTGRAQVVTFIGAGGKTTCLRSITREIDSAGHRVIATTTTKVFPEKLMKMDSYKPLLDLNDRWSEIQREIKDLEYRPKHLRLAAGDAKEGKLQWFDLW